jgi:predicted nucleic acid-binding protein
VAKVALDADVVIAFLDASDDRHQRSIELLRPSLSAGDSFVLAACVYAEILVHPLQRGSDKMVDDFLVAVGAGIVAVDRQIARHAARLRASHRAIRLADALSLATALAAGAELLTLDHRLAKIAVNERAKAQGLVHTAPDWNTSSASR